jgi:hypothetical protein
LPHLLARSLGPRALSVIFSAVAAMGAASQGYQSPQKLFEEEDDKCNVLLKSS